MNSGIPPGTAAALAQESDSIAAALDRGDRCRAASLADDLASASRRAPMPASYRPPLVAASDALAARIDCPPPPPPPAAPPKPEQKHHKKHEKKHGKHEHGKKGPG